MGSGNSSSLLPQPASDSYKVMTLEECEKLSGEVWSSELREKFDSLKSEEGTITRLQFIEAVRVFLQGNPSLRDRLSISLDALGGPPNGVEGVNKREPKALKRKQLKNKNNSMGQPLCPFVKLERHFVESTNSYYYLNPATGEMHYLGQVDDRVSCSALPANVEVVDVKRSTATPKCPFAREAAAAPGTTGTHAEVAPTASTFSSVDSGTHSSPYIDPDTVTVLTHSRPSSYSHSDMSIALLENIGGPDTILEVCNKFYEKAFLDKVFDTFISSHDKPHAKRLADYIVEKMSGEPVWTNVRPDGARQRAHADSWKSKKRPVELQGRRFKLDDCRMWMRLMFWSAREVGLMDPHFAAFMKWYKMFIRYFIAIYEVAAPAYVDESLEWSAKEENIKTYLDNGRHMVDVIGVGTSQNAWPNFYA